LNDTFIRESSFSESAFN